jgi:hypothetical protein
MKTLQSLPTPRFYLWSLKHKIDSIKCFVMILGSSSYLMSQDVIASKSLTTTKRKVFQMHS